MSESSNSVGPVRNTWGLLIFAWILFVVPIPGTGMVGWVLNLAAFIMTIVVLVKGKVSHGVFQLISVLIISPIIYFMAIGFNIYTALSDPSLNIPFYTNPGASINLETGIRDDETTYDPNLTPSTYDPNTPHEWKVIKKLEGEDNFNTDDFTISSNKIENPLGSQKKWRIHLYDVICAFIRCGW